MISQELKELKTGPRDLRKFGLLVGGVFAAIGNLMCARGKPRFPYFLAPGAALMAIGAVFPKGLKQVYLAWMGLALVLGLVVSTVLLTVFFFLIITPVGLVARLCGNDFLSLKLDRRAATYWLPRDRKKPKPPSDFERQF